MRMQPWAACPDGENRIDMTDEKPAHDANNKLRRMILDGAGSGAVPVELRTAS